MKHRTICFAAGLMAAVCFAGCSGGKPATGGQDAPPEVRAAIMTADSGVRETVLFADPEGAAEAIYSMMSSAPSLTQVDTSELSKVLGVEPEDVEDALVYTSDPKDGLCDLAMILPVEGASDNVREALMQYRALRAEEFRNYDILGSYDIASNAVVFNQGDYVVLLMLPDNEEAQDILDQYMPK